MNKGNIVDAVASKAKVTKVVALAIVNEVLNSMKGALASGDKITLVGFGTFDTAVRKARMGRNPKTGEALAIPEKVAVTFKAGTALKEMVNGSIVTEKSDVIEATEAETNVDNIDAQVSDSQLNADFEDGENDLEKELQSEVIDDSAE